MPPSPAAASGSAPSRPTITVLVTAIAMCARLAAASGAASAKVALSSAPAPKPRISRRRGSARSTGSKCLSNSGRERRRSPGETPKKEEPRPIPAGPHFFVYSACSAHAHTLGPHGAPARGGDRLPAFERANHAELVEQGRTSVNRLPHPALAGANLTESQKPNIVY